MTVRRNEITEPYYYYYNYYFTKRTKINLIKNNRFFHSKIWCKGRNYQFSAPSISQWEIWKVSTFVFACLVLSIAPAVRVTASCQARHCTLPLQQGPLLAPAAGSRSVPFIVHIRFETQRSPSLWSLQNQMLFIWYHNLTSETVPYMYPRSFLDVFTYPTHPYHPYYLWTFFWSTLASNREVQ